MTFNNWSDRPAAVTKEDSTGDSWKVTCSLDGERPAPGPVTMVDQ